MNHLERSKIEQKETEPKPFATFFIVRHGDTMYNEEFKDKNSEFDLTETGIKQIKDLASQIEKETEPHETIWVIRSPRVRAKSTVEILEKQLKETGHNVVGLGGGRPSLSNVKIYNQEGKNIYKEKDEQKYLSDMEKVLERVSKETDYYVKSRKGSLENPITESIEDYKKKVKTLLAGLIKFVHKRQGNNEKIILVTHSEWLDTLLENYFGKKIEKEVDSAPTGGLIELKILQDKLIFSFANEKIIVKNKLQ